MKILNRLFPEIKTESKPLKMVTEKKEPVTAYSIQDEKIKEIFDKQNVPLTDEALQDVKAFLNETEGDLESKLKTVELALEKDVPITKANLNRIHTALHEPLNLDTKNLNLIDVKKAVALIPEEFKKDLVTTNGEKLPSEVLVKAFITKQLSIILSKDSEAPSPEKYESLKNETTLAKEMNTLEVTSSDVKAAESKQLESHLVNDSLEDDDIKMITEAFETLADQLDDLTEMLFPVVDQPIFAEPQAVQKLLETEVTVKMIEAKETFQMYQKAITAQLDKVIALPENATSLKEVLSSVIDKLDHILMKSDVTMYTDIKSERDLLASSSELEKARQLIGQDDVKALKIVKEVKGRIDEIRFNPSRQKMMGVTQQALVNNLYDEKMIKALPLNINHDMNLSPRAVLDTIRGLGINHEAEVSELLQKDQKTAFKTVHNMKSVLLKLEETTHQKIASKENLEHLTGQQLMNKLEIKSQKQSMTFTVPVKIDGDVKQLKVHVNAKKDRQKIDWKNSRLYFVIHLDKLGDTGVLVDVTNANVNVTIKNDHPDVEDLMQPYVEEALTRLEEVGFSASHFKFETLKEKQVVVKDRVFTEVEGFDVSI